MDIPNVTYRVAEPGDAQEIARLLGMTSGGLIDFLFRSPNSESTLGESIAPLVRSETGLLSYRNIEVACWSDRAIGMAHGYASVHHHITEEMKQILSKNHLQVLEAFDQNPMKNSWFLNAFGVRAEYRKQGIGTSLLWRTKQKAWQSGFTTLSAIAGSDNRTALRLYHQNGFREVAQIPIPQHPEFYPGRSCVLMSCQIVI
ncbi:MAG: GNAT family N-acetyltransferase [Limnospira sp.]